MIDKIKIQFMEKMRRKDMSTMDYDTDPGVSVMPKPNSIAISFYHKAPIEIISINILINSITCIV